MVSMLERDAKFRSVIPLIRSLDLGTTPQEIYLKSHQFVIDKPEAHVLPHQGRILNIP